MNARRGDPAQIAVRHAFETCDEGDGCNAAGKRQVPDLPQKLSTIPAFGQLLLYARDLSPPHHLNGGRNSRHRRGRGGARNKADRISEALSAARVEILFRAAWAAIRIGLPLNRHVTIHWERLGVPDRRAAKATGDFLRLVRDWLRQRGLKTSWVWVRENGQGKGSHVHIALHVPSQAPWTFGRLRSWLERVAAGPYVVRSIMTTRIAGRADAASRSPELYEHNLSGLLGYMTKQSGAHSGRVIGKRCGHSQNLGSAMKNSGDRRNH